MLEILKVLIIDVELDKPGQKIFHLLAYINHWSFKLSIFHLKNSHVLLQGFTEVSVYIFQYKIGK
jgi:hypothetical protein